MSSREQQFSNEWEVVVDGGASFTVDMHDLQSAPLAASVLSPLSPLHPLQASSNISTLSSSPMSLPVSFAHLSHSSSSSSSSSSSAKQMSPPSPSSSPGNARSEFLNVKSMEMDIVRAGELSASPPAQGFLQSKSDSLSPSFHFLPSIDTSNDVIFDAQRFSHPDLTHFGSPDEQESVPLSPFSLSLLLLTKPKVRSWGC